jgi:ankyrin repeat protein
MLPPNNSIPPPPPSRTDVEDFCTAARNGDRDGVVKYLDQYGPAIINERDNIQARAITWAAFAGHTEIVALLLDRGADINSPGTSGKPPLSWAAEQGREETMAFLLDRGASLEARDDSGLTPMDYAQRSGNSAISGLIEQWQENQRQGILKATQREAQQKESEARAAVAERLRKLKDSQPGRFKIEPHPKRRSNGGPRR